MRAVLVCLLAALAVSANVPKPFKGQQSYVYRFDTQVSSSLAGSTATEIQQQAATRLRADVHISFTNDRHAKVQLQHVRLGELNTELPKPQRVQPLEHFERIEIPQELKQQLELPFSVSIVDGTVERINFDESQQTEKPYVAASETFSKNIKRAVLNMINLNLKRNDVNGKELRSMSESEKNANVFELPELTLEGECYSVYTIQQQQRPGQQQSEQEHFNVTKSINFAKCTKTPVISFGYSPKASQEIKCADCMRTQNTQQQQQQNAQQQELIRNTHCQQECMPWKLNADNDVERSTFARYELQGKLDRYAIKRSTILSSYIVKGQNPASENAIMQVVSLSELTFKEMRDNDKLVPSFKQSSIDETLIYDPRFDVDERRWYQEGDETFEKNSPFAIMQKKDQKTAHAMRSILKQWTKKSQGYELDTAMHFNRLVQLMRESSVVELRKIEDTIRSGSQSNDEQQSWCESDNVEKCKEHARELFIDALAVAATRNTLWVLAEKIMKNEISAGKATAALQLFNANIHSPSEQQVEILKKIAMHEVAHRSGPLKQAAWLVFGSTIGQLCQQQPTQPAQAYFRVETVCSRGKRENWRKTLLQLWNDADTQYEQILALKAIGNSALDVMLPELQKIIMDKRQPTLIRGESIDALRRLRTTQSQAIRQTLMPIFMDTASERPEIRMAALSMILFTQPEKALLDQIAFSIIAERSQNVKTFVFTALKALSQSPASAEREIADHLKAQLKVIELSEEEMRASRVIRAPVYVSEKETSADQTVFLALATVVSPNSMLPAYIAGSIRTALNGQAPEENIKISFTQQNLEQFYQRMGDMFEQYQNTEDEDEKSNMERRGAKDLRSLYSSLGLKSRRTGSYFVESNEDDEQQWDEQDREQDREQQDGRSSSRRVSDSRKPFAMLVLRASEVDMAVLPISEQQLPSIVRKMLVDQKKPSMSELEELTRMLPSGRIEKHGALSLNEKKTKIPTTSGLPLALIRQVTAVGSVEAQLRTQMESSDASSSSRGLEAHLKLHTSGVVTHQYETVVWTPILSTGIKTLRTAELNLPVELKIRADNKQVEVKMMPMRGEEKTRVLGFHSLPLSYTRHVDMATQTKREARVKTMQNYALEHTQREWRADEQSERAIIVDGHYHMLSSWSPKALLQTIYTTENNVHVYLGQQAPRELVLRVSGSAFEKHSQHGKPEFDNFYSQEQSSQNKGFKSIFEEDDENLQSERDEDRRQSLETYNKNYNGEQAYKHSIKVEMLAHYTQSQTARAVVELKGACDSRLKHCKMFVEAERSPIRSLRESQPWTLRAKVQTIAPELIRDEEEPSSKQSRMLVRSEITFGTEEEKNELNLRIQMEPTKTTMWAGKQSQQQTSDKWSRFLNKLDVRADYRLQPYAKHLIQSMYSAAKSRVVFWPSTESRRGDENTVRATIVIDPMTRQYANISVQTPHERLRVEGVEVPATVLALSTIQLNRRPTQYHSLSSMVNDYTGFEKAQCKVDERRVKTFDGVNYRAPMSECWHVLAKDCSREQPRFAVLMKKADETRVKIITPESTIELWRSSDNERVKVKVNDEQVKDEQRLSEQGIELSYDRVYVQKRGLSVTFDGEEAKIELSQQYKNKQCGLCGVYNDEEDDEFRNTDGKRSGSMKEFHKQYTLKNQECDESRINKFYKDNDEERFDRDDEHKREQARRRYGSGNRRSQWFDSDEESEESRRNEKRGEGWMNSNSQEETDTKNIKPVEQTAVYEYNHRICFSTEPVRRCPRGTSPDEEAKTQSKKTSFFCVDRTQGRKFQRQIRHGEQIDSEGRAPAFVETIQQPTKCVAY